MQRISHLIYTAARTSNTAQQLFVARALAFQSTSSSESSSWQYHVALAAAAGAAGLLSLNLVAVAHGDASEPQQLPKSVRIAQFQQWMAANGADWSAVKVQPKRQDAEQGLGLFATPAIRSQMSHPWLGRRLGALLLPGHYNQIVTVAAIPVQLALTAQKARADRQLGPHYGELLDLGVADERDIVILMLMIERLRGAASHYAPYIALLPERFDTPLWFSEAQLSELAGTTLAAATAAHQASLQRKWTRLQPAATDMLKQVGVNATPAFDHFKWATSVFWSRGLGLPLPTWHLKLPQQQPAGVPAGDTLEPAAEAAALAAEEDSKAKAAAVAAVLRIDVHEGLVPGLDFANHCNQACCWWEVAEAPQQHRQHDPLQQQLSLQQQQLHGGQAAADAYAIQFMANRACCPKSGEELTISYGEKGNEELLLLYGFALPNNPHETLMLLCPLPPHAEWDDTFNLRMQLLQAQGLTPQLFLSAAHLREYQSSIVNTHTGTNTPNPQNSIIPPAARQVLEVFVMQPQELFAKLHAAEHGQQQQQQQPAQQPGAQGNTNTHTTNQQQLQVRIDQLGLALAVLTTFVRLLELKLIEMEGATGTGPFENDVHRLEQADLAAAAALARESLSTTPSSAVTISSAAGPQSEAGQMPDWLQSCILYRAGQKSLAREYLTAARHELQETLSELQACIEAAGQL